MMQKPEPQWVPCSKCGKSVDAPYLGYHEEGCKGDYDSILAELAALREPTEAMICAGGTAVERTKHLTGCERAKRIYLAMLDAALASSSQGEG